MGNGLYVAEMCDQSLPVTCNRVMKQSQVFASEAGMPKTNLKANRVWVWKRVGFLLCLHASVCGKLPATYEEKVVAFHGHFLKLHDSRQYFLGQTGNAGQTTVYFDITSNMMVSVKGAREVKLLTIGNEKMLFTVMLSCLADGKLRPYLVFK